MHPELHTDLDNLDTVENNLPNSAKGSLDTYDVTVSLTIAGKGENSLQHYNLVHKFNPMPQAMKISAAKAAVDKEWEKLRKFRRGT